MEFFLFYGPDKVPFSLDEYGKVLCDYAIPFHGIISRGLLQKFEENGIDSEIWHKYAHLIGNDLALKLNTDSRLLQEYVFSCEVLSFSDSTVSVRSYINNLFNNSSKDEQLTCELWNIKEGHTSCVWKVTIVNKNNFMVGRFVVNVARDQAAGFELKAASKKMQDITKNCPGINIAKTYDIQNINLSYCNKSICVIVTRNEWIENSYEIHLLIPAKDHQKQYVLVDRFITSPNSPSQISAIQGRKLSEDECSKVENDLALVLKASNNFNTQININEGDMVWNGERAIVVAIS